MNKDPSDLTLNLIGLYTEVLIPLTNQTYVGVGIPLALQSKVIFWPFVPSNETGGRSMNWGRSEEWNSGWLQIYNSVTDA